jgi:chorismate dehydratase
MVTLATPRDATPRAESADPRVRPAASLRLGVVSYLNVAPIIHSLKADPLFELVSEVPAKVAERLHRADIDLGTIPSVEYAFGDYAIVPGIAIGSHGPVRSVCLYHPGPLESVRRVALDTSSRTSVALLKILLRERLGRDPEYVSMGPSLDSMLAVADAGLLIGDPALYCPSDLPRLDLGEEWTRTTGLPFVYAFWAGRPGVVSAAEVARLQESLRDGLAALGAIAAGYNGDEPGRAAVNESYLRGNIVFTFGVEEEAGLREFYRRAHALSLIPGIPELRFHAQA